VENEFDHIFFGYSDSNPKPDPKEVSDWEWITLEKLKNELIEKPEAFSPWLQQCFNEVIAHKLARGNVGNQG
jgi:isopentenyl-diphosphate Delta-isomerase